MANNSAKQNESKIRGWVLLLNYTVYGLIIWNFVFNTFYLIGQAISIWHFIVAIMVQGSTYFLKNQIIKCLELQLPVEAAEYYYDIIAINALVLLIDPYSHNVWYLYYLIVLFLLWQGAKWLWDYITPKYEQVEQKEEGSEDKKKQKKEKQKIKYIKR